MFNNRLLQLSDDSPKPGISLDNFHVEIFYLFMSGAAIKWGGCRNPTRQKQPDRNPAEGYYIVRVFKIAQRFYVGSALQATHTSSSTRRPAFLCSYYTLSTF